MTSKNFFLIPVNDKKLYMLGDQVFYGLESPADDNVDPTSFDAQPDHSTGIGLDSDDRIYDDRDGHRYLATRKEMIIKNYGEHHSIRRVRRDLIPYYEPEEKTLREETYWIESDGLTHGNIRHYDGEPPKLFALPADKMLLNVTNGKFLITDNTDHPEEPRYQLFLLEPEDSLHAGKLLIDGYVIDTPDTAPYLKFGDGSIGVLVEIA